MRGWLALGKMKALERVGFEGVGCGGVRCCLGELHRFAFEGLHRVYLLSIVVFLGSWCMWRMLFDAVGAAMVSSWIIRLSEDCRIRLSLCLFLMPNIN